MLFNALIVEMRFIIMQFVKFTPAVSRADSVRWHSRTSGFIKPL